MRLRIEIEKAPGEMERCWNLQVCKSIAVPKGMVVNFNKSVHLIHGTRNLIGKKLN